MKNTLFLTILLFIFCINTKAQDDNPIVEVSVKEMKDSVSFYISNKTYNDTIYFSIYKQELINDKTHLTSVYDIFCDISNPKTTTLRLLPNEKIEFTIKDRSIVVVEEDENIQCRVINVKYRYVFKVIINDIKENVYNIYSNYLP